MRWAHSRNECAAFVLGRARDHSLFMAMRCARRLDVFGREASLFKLQPALLRRLFFYAELDDCWSGERVNAVAP